MRSTPFSSAKTYPATVSPQTVSIRTLLEGMCSNIKTSDVNSAMLWGSKLGTLNFYASKDISHLQSFTFANCLLSCPFSICCTLVPQVCTLLPISRNPFLHLKVAVKKTVVPG